MVRNKQKNKKPTPKGPLLAFIVSLLLLISSIGFVYWTSLDTQNWKTECNPARQSVSVDGLVVVGEADLGCIGESKRKRAEEAQRAIGLLIVSVSAVSVLVSLVLLLRKAR